MQPADTLEAFWQPASHQPPASLVDDLDVVMVLGPVITHEQHPHSSLDDLQQASSVEKTFAIS